MLNPITLRVDEKIFIFRAGGFSNSYGVDIYGLKSIVEQIMDKILQRELSANTKKSTAILNTTRP